VIAAEEGAFVILESAASRDTVEAFYQAHLAETGWVLFERLQAPENRFGGKAVFLLFWQPGQAACVLAASAPRQKTSITLSKDCATTRMTAENLRTVPWAAPDGVMWSLWEAPTFTLRYPTDWTEDEGLFQQPYCQQANDIRCLAGFTYRGEKGPGFFSLIARPRPSSKSLEELAIESWRDGAKTVPNLALIAAEPIRLDDGISAVQILSFYKLAEEWGILLAVYVATDRDLYMLTGTVVGEPKPILELSQVVGAMARSFHLTR